MSRWLTLLVLFCAHPLLAQSVVILSEDGKSAWFAPDEVTRARAVDRIVRLSGDTTLPPGDPDDPLPPSEDKWGLVAFSETEAKKVAGDAKRDETAAKLGIAYVVIGKQVQDGKITQGQLKAALELTFRFTTGSAQDEHKTTVRASPPPGKSGWRPIQYQSRPGQRPRRR